MEVRIGARQGIITRARGGGLSTVYLLIKVACIVKKGRVMTAIIKVDLHEQVQGDPPY